METQILKLLKERQNRPASFEFITKGKKLAGRLERIKALERLMEKGEVRRLKGCEFFITRKGWQRLHKISDDPQRSILVSGSPERATKP